MKISKALVLFGLALSAGGLAKAATINWRVTGTLTNVSQSGIPLPVSISAGQQYVLDFSFDPQVANSSLQPAVGQYFGAVQSGATLSTATAALNFVFGGDITVINDERIGPEFRDGLGIGLSTALPANFTGILWWGSVAFERQVPGPAPIAPFDSTALPVDIPDITPFYFRQLQLRYAQYLNGSLVGSEVVFGSVDSLQAVPIPAAAWLLLSGLAAVGGAARRSLRQA